MKILVLGPGCANCRTLEHRTREALDEMNLEAEIEKVEKIDDIISYGVLRTPGLVINGKVVSQGMVPPVVKIKELISASSIA